MHGFRIFQEKGTFLPEKDMRHACVFFRVPTTGKPSFYEASEDTIAAFGLKFLEGMFVN